jgi:penicillin-binding protein 1A
VRRYTPLGMSSVTVHPPLGMPEPPARTARPPRPGPPGPPVGRPRPGARRPTAPRKKNVKKPGFFWRYRRIWFLLGFVFFTALAGAVFVVTQIPLPSEAPLAQTTVIFDGAGNQMAELHGVENRYPVRIEQVPIVTQMAVIAAEDRHFLKHRGIDPWSIARATWADIRQKGAMQGGSTITQQYVKNQIVGSERSLVRKLKEAVVAVKIERKYNKLEILEKYLNTVYFGRGAYGIQAAANTYFKKDVGELDLKESAYLAGLIRTPATGDVFTDRDSAYYLRTSVLRNMVKDGSITQEDADAVEKVEIEKYVFRPEPSDTTFTNVANGAEYFVDYVRQQLIKEYGEDRVFRGGLRVYTTLDPKVQEYAYDAIYGTLDDPENDPVGALVSLDPEGRVVAMVGNRDWKVSQVNVAVGTDGGGSGRQGGSAFKPFVLAEALKQGKISPERDYYNGGSKIGPLPGWEEEVHNYNDANYGFVNLIDATVNSVNTVYAQLVGDVGAANVAATAKELGITSKLNAVPSISLGTQEVSVLEMASAYLTFFRDGTRVDPRVVAKVTEGGTVLVDDKPSGQRRVLSRDVARQVKEILGQVVERGTGTQAQIPGGAWGKTGTTEEYGDAWFVGANDKLVTAVWMGYPEGQSRALNNIHGVTRVSGGTLPAFIFKKFMLKAAPGDDKTPTTEPVLDARVLNGSASGGRSNTTVASESSNASSSATTAPPSPTTTAVTVPASDVTTPTPTTTEPPASPSTVLTAPTVTFPTPTTSRRTTATSPRTPDFPSFSPN